MTDILTELEGLELQAAPAPWKWLDGWDALPEDFVDGIEEKYLECELVANDKTDVLPIRVDHHEFVYDTATNTAQDKANRALIVAMRNHFKAPIEVAKAAKKIRLQHDGDLPIIAGLARLNETLAKLEEGKP